MNVATDAVHHSRAVNHCQHETNEMKNDEAFAADEECGWSQRLDLKEEE